MIDPLEVAKGIARVSANVMDYLGASAGDAIAIINSKGHAVADSDTGEYVRRGKRRTVATCMPMTAATAWEKDAIKLDGLARNNAGAQVGDSVQVKKAKRIPAKQVTFKLMENIPLGDLLRHVDGDIKRIIFADFDSSYISKGDVIYPSYYGGRITFVVEGIEPKMAEEDENVAALMDRQNTVIEISNTS